MSYLHKVFIFCDIIIVCGDNLIAFFKEVNQKFSLFHKQFDNQMQDQFIETLQYILMERNQGNKKRSKQDRDNQEERDRQGQRNNRGRQHRNHNRNARQQGGPQIDERIQFQRRPQDRGNRREQTYNSYAKCQYGIDCKFLYQETKKCKKFHHFTELETVKFLKFIQQKNQVIVAYVNHRIYFYGLLELPSQFMKSQYKPKTNKYIKCTYIGENKHRDIILNPIQEIGDHTDRNIELNVLKSSPNWYQNNKVQQYTEGFIKIGRGGRKILQVLRGGKDMKFDYVGKDQKRLYPFLNKCKIKFTGHLQNELKIHHINYSKIFVSGKLQIVDGTLIFKSRSKQVDDMTPLSLPEAVLEKINIPQLDQYTLVGFPYQFNKKQVLEINKKLDGFLVFGKFHSWPPLSRHPIVQLNDQVRENNIKQIKEAIIYEYKDQISGQNFTDKQKKEAKKLIQQMKDMLKKQEKKEKQSKRRIFTIDSLGTLSRDDAISIQELDDQNWHRVGIHVTNVAYWIREKDQLNIQAQKRDSTIYIKNYHFKMLPDQLSNNHLSLIQNTKRQLLSVYFQINNEGLIDFNSIKFVQEFQHIDKNFTHKQAEKLNDSSPFFNGLQILKKLLLKRKQLQDEESLICQYESENVISKLMSLSSYFCGFLLYRNFKSVAKISQKISDYIDKKVEQISHQFEPVQKSLKEFQAINKEIQKLKLNQKKIKNQQKKQLLSVEQKLKRLAKELNKLNKEKKQSAKVLKEKRKKEKKKKQRKEKNIIDGQSQSEQQGSQTNPSQKSKSEVTMQQLRQLHDQQSESQSEENAKNLLKMDELVNQINDQMNEAKKNIKKEKNQKAKIDLQQKQVNQKIFQNENEKEQTKRHRAKKASGFLEPIFRYFQLNPKPTTVDEIQKNFKIIISKKKYDHNQNKTYKQYFQTVRITNKQYFRYIAEQNSQEKGRIQKKQNKIEAKEQTEGKKYPQKPKGENQEKQEAMISKNNEKQKHNKKGGKQRNKQRKKQIKKQIQQVKKKQTNIELDQMNLLMQKYMIVTKKCKQPQTQVSNGNNKNETINEQTAKKNKKQKTKKQLRTEKKQHKEQKREHYKQRTRTRKQKIQQQKQSQKIQKNFKQNVQEQNKSQTKTSRDQMDLMMQKYLTSEKRQNKLLVQQSNNQHENNNISKHCQDNSLKKEKTKEKNQKNQQNIQIKQQNLNEMQNQAEKKEYQMLIEKKISQLSQTIQTVKQSIKVTKAAYDAKIQSIDSEINEIEDKKIQIKTKVTEKNQLWKLIKEMIIRSKKSSQLSNQEKTLTKLCEGIKLILAPPSAKKKKMKKNKKKVQEQKQQEDLDKILTDFIRTTVAPEQLLNKNIQEENQQFFKFVTQQSTKKLKWNNPLRSFNSLLVQRLIQDYIWLFKGKVHPLDALELDYELERIKKKVDNIRQKQLERQIKGQINKVSKKINMQIAIWEFYYLWKKKANREMFLNILPPNQETKLVYHPILGGMLIKNKNQIQQQKKYFQQVEGELKLQSDFPVNFQAIISRQ